MSSDAVDKIVAAVEQHRAAMSAVAARKLSATRRAYEAEHCAAVELLGKLRRQLDANLDRHNADPENWGYVGDLQHINSLLRQALGEE